MTDLIDQFYVFISAAGLLISMMGQWLVAVMPGSERWSRRFFRSYFFALMLCCISSIIEGVLYYCPVPNAAIYFVVALECLLLSLPMPMMTAYLLHCCGEDVRKNRLFRTVLCLMAVYFILVAVGPFIGWYTYITPDMQYIRKPIYSLLLVPVVTIMLLNLAGLIKRREQLAHKVFIAFHIGMVPLAVSLIVQMFIDILPIVDISYVLSALVMYSFVLSEQIEQDLRYQQEIANQRADIMVLQMRPHFIYNTMTSIYCLCNQDPKRARQVIMDFTTYLRRNFTAIASADPIPFSAELEHTKAYLAVEQAQYEDSLYVEYDTPHTLFRIPPLTLQPVVENAVKHGRDPYSGPFHISIRTRKTDSGSEIVVADDGVGFVCDGNDEPHIALNNIKKRLEIMCGGSLSIISGREGGTAVTITIPDNPPG